MMKQKTLSAILTFCMALIILFEPICVYSAEDLSVCGNKIYWWFSDRERTLTISMNVGSSGVMYDYRIGGTPWNSYLGRIENVIIGEGICNIGNYAFACLTRLKNVEIPNSVTTIGEGTFDCCIQLQKITIPGSVTSIDKSAFSGCIALETVKYLGSKEQWELINIGDDNEKLMEANISFSEEKKVALLYNANGGYGVPESQIGAGTFILSSIVPRRIGHTFLGWGMTPDAIQPKYQPGDIVAFQNEDVVLYAVWKKTAYVTVNNISATGTLVLQIFTTGIPENSQIVLSCYQGEQLSYVEPVTKVENQDTYYFIPTGDYTSAKVMVFENFDTLYPIIEPVFVE